MNKMTSSAVQKADYFLAKGFSAHQTGNFEKAEKIYRRILKTHPNHGDALHFLGLLAHQNGKNEAALKLITKATQAKPEDVSIYTNLAIVYNALMQWQQAEGACRAALEIQADHSEASNNLGRALTGQGKFDGAENAYCHAVRSDRKNAAAYNNLGLLYMQSGETENAEVVFRQAIDANSNFILAYTNLASALSAQQRQVEAIEVCLQALGMQPNNVSALLSLGVARSGISDFDGAEEAFKKLIAIQPDHNQAVSNLGSVYSVRQRFDEAVALFRQALVINPGSPHAHLNLGMVLSETGQLEEAVNSFRRAVMYDPENIDAYYALAMSGREEFDDDTLDRVSKLSHHPSLTADHMSKAQFTLGMQWEKKGYPEKAFTCYQQGNKIRALELEEMGQSFNSGEFLEQITAIKEHFSAEYFADHEGWGIESEQPVFIVGMPRSGTTLVEQIVASHPDATGIGERAEIMNIANDLAGINGRFPEGIETLTPAEVTKLADNYLLQIDKLGNGAARVADKMPFNFLYLGLIHLLFPKAKIIFCRRDPLDTGLSCYFQNFVQSHPWTCDLSHIGHHSNGCRELMVYWGEVFPNSILVLDYEKLVADQETWTRSIIDHIGLDWNPACLDFHRAGNAVRTASKWQVRRPVYSQSVARWKPYEKQLQPLADVLDSKGII